jgi:hypothetical protein
LIIPFAYLLENLRTFPPPDLFSRFRTNQEVGAAFLFCIAFSEKGVEKLAGTSVQLISQVGLLV